MKSLSQENRADIIEAFNSTSRYLDDLLNIDNIYFDQMVDRIYLTELQFITKTFLYYTDPLKPHFYIVKLGFTGVYIIFLIFAQKHGLWVLVRTASPRRF